MEPWNELADAVSLALLGVDSAAPLRTTEEGRRRASAVLDRFRLCYELPNFSLGRAAETVVTQLDRLRMRARSADDKRDGHPAGDLLLETRTLLACAAPILVDVADALRAEGVDLDLASVRDESVPAFRFPQLPATTTPTGRSPALDGAR
ncbi:hypothetical protein [Saccharothrix sp. NRRL B-16348]|uniref:hypothetical protein n=1 Tax=Saccharothrix sp. NRRL B-16348 TaxID=1415542 RepID=UPI000AD1470D|nr:hypothetical protein [Saccharothrix sp. NRRL B-16348]